MKIPSWMRTYGNQSYRGDCPHEDYALASFVDRIRKDYPSTYGLVLFHPKNEGKRTTEQMKADKRKGFKKGVCDIVIAGNPTLFMELKRNNPMKSKWQDGQVEFLKAAHDGGAYVVLALGYEAALQAFDDWLTLQ